MIPVTKENKQEAERQQIELLRKNNIELVVLARYMQVLSTSFIEQFPQQIINIHHSFCLHSSAQSPTSKPSTVA